MSEPVTGGCQCGAVRFRVDGQVGNASVCHCRMCQKATGGLFGAVGSVQVSDLRWTRGKPSTFNSSSLAERGFCSACGTPLTYFFPGSDTIAITLGSFDDPKALKIDFALAVDNAHPALATILDVPEEPIASTPEEKAAFAEMRNFQHPDHDTSDWPPEEEK